MAVVVAVPAGALAQAGAPATDAPTADGVEASSRITEIRVEGNRRVEKDAVARAMKQKVGDAFNPIKTADDIRALWALKYFSDVQLLVQRTPSGIAYVVRVVEKPAVRNVSLSGNDELSKDDFKDAIDIKPYSILDLAAVMRDVKKIQDKYVEKGFFLAEVTQRIDPVPGSTEVDVVFVINEHAKVMVKEINFLGSKRVTPEEIKPFLQTKEGGYLSFITSEGTYREELFQRDLQGVQAVYYDHGFVNVKVDKPVVSLSADKRFIYISMKVEEGEQYNVGKLDFSGDLIVSKQAMQLVMQTKSDQVFNRSALAKDLQALSDVYFDDGYAYANITPVTAVNASSRTIDLTFDVQKGQQVTIERIDISGNARTRDKVIRRQLRVFEGEKFSGSGLRRSKDKAMALGFFDTVDVSHKPGSDDKHVVINVEVKEKSTGSFQVGMGFSNVESFIFTGQVMQQNFLGWGPTVSANLQLSALRTFFQLSYFDPYFLDTNFLLSVDAFSTQLDYFGFIRDSKGGTASLGYYLLADEMSLSLGYTQEWVRIEQGRSYNSQVSLYGQFRSGVTSAVRVSWTWDRRNNRIYPSAGTLSFASAELAPQFLSVGGKNNSYLFNRYTAYQRGYISLPFGIVLKGNVQVGYIQQMDRENSLPSSELYFLGGINTVRGYPLRSVTPKTLVGTSTEPTVSTASFGVGGDKQVIVNVELEFPIFEKVGIRGVLFYDAGNAFARDSSFFQDKDYPNLPLGLFHSVGFGFRWISPIGPLRFEWGIPLNKRPEDQAIQFEFNIGNSF